MCYHDCIVSFQLQENGCPVSARWDGELWAFSVDDCAKDWGIPPEEIATANLRMHEYGRFCRGIEDPREVIKVLRHHGEQAELV